MRCPECGSWNPDSDKYCGQCGRLLREREEPASSASEMTDSVRRCPSCNNMVLEDERSCSNCGIIFSENRFPIWVSYPVKEEKSYPHIVWKFPFALWETVLMSYEQFVMRSILTWGVLLIFSVLFLTRGFWQGVIIILAIFIPIYYITWKAGVEEAVWYRNRS